MSAKVPNQRHGGGEDEFKPEIWMVIEFEQARQSARPGWPIAMRSPERAHKPPLANKVARPYAERTHRVLAGGHTSTPWYGIGWQFHDGPVELPTEDARIRGPRATVGLHEYGSRVLSGSEPPARPCLPRPEAHHFRRRYAALTL